MSMRMYPIVTATAALELVAGVPAGTGTEGLFLERMSLDELKAKFQNRVIKAKVTERIAEHGWADCRETRRAARRDVRQDIQRDRWALDHGDRWDYGWFLYAVRSSLFPQLDRLHHFETNGWGRPRNASYDYLRWLERMRLEPLELHYGGGAVYRREHVVRMLELHGVELSRLKVEAIDGLHFS